MVGEVSYHAIRCCRCGLYQVQQVKKSGRFQCVKCRAQQKVDKEFYRGPSKECREIVQALSKAAHLGKIDFTPAPSTAYQEPVSPKRRTGNGGSSKFKEKPVQVKKSNEKSSPIENEEESLFSLDSPERKRSPDNPSGRASSGSGVSIADPQASGNRDTAAKSCWRRRSLEKLAKFRLTDGTDESTTVCNESETKRDNKGASELKEHTSPENHSSDEKDQSQLETGRSEDTLNDLFDLSDTPQRSGSNPNNLKEESTPRIEKHVADSHTLQDDSDEGLFNSIETPLKSNSSDRKKPEDENGTHTSTITDRKELLDGMANQPQTVVTETTSESNKLQDNSRLSDEYDNDLFNLVETPLKSGIRKDTENNGTESPKTLATGRQDMSGDDDIFDGIATPETKCMPKNKLPPTKVSTRKSSDTANEQFDGGAPTNEGSIEGTNSKDTSNTNSIWRRRSLSKLLKFRYDPDEEGDKTEVTMKDTRCEESPKSSRNVESRGKEQLLISEKKKSITQPIVTKEEKQLMVEDDLTKLSPATVGREKLLKTLERFKVTPSPKRRKIL